MAKTKISQFDATAANNTDLNSISIAEGTAPSNINNAIRELMSQLADLNLGNEVLSTLKIDNLHLDGNTIVTLDTNGDLNLTPNGTGSVTIAKADINGGNIDATPIGASSESTGAFTTLSASSTANLGSTVTVSGGNVDAVIGANTPAAITGTVITANTNFAGDITGNVTGNVTGNLTGNVTGNVTGDVTGDITGNITASTGSSTFNNVTINGTLDMDSTTTQTITGLATPSGSSDAATKGYVDTEVSALVDSAPATLDTLNELAAALGDDANYATTTTNAIAAKLPLAGGTMTGNINLDSNSLTNLAAPSGANDAATKTYVDTADALKLNLSGGTMSGDINADSNKVTNLATPTNTGDATSKSYVDGILGSATSAATSASNASTSATNAANSATASASSATASASSATSAAASYDSFDDRYLGAKGSAPTVDNDGDALLTGALYFNTSSNQLFVWTSGDAWTQAAFTASGFLSGSNNLSDVDNVSTSRTNLGLAIGSDVQAHDADLDALAGLTSAADKGIQFTGSGTAATYDLTSAGKALLDDADAAAQRTTLGLGSVSTLDAGTSANNAVQLDGSAKLPAVDGSALTGMASGGTVSLVADGGITAGKPCILTAAGKAAQIAASGESVTEGIGSNQAIDTSNLKYIATCKLADTKFLLVYNDVDGSNYPTARIGTVDPDNKTISYGTAVVLASSSEYTYTTCAYDTNASRIGIFCTSTTTYSIKAITGTFSGTTLSMNSFADLGSIDAGGDIFPHALYDPDNNAIVVVVEGAADNNTLTAMEVDVSGSTASVNFSATKTSTNWRAKTNSTDNTLTYDTSTNRFVYIFEDEDDNDNIKGIVLASSGSAFTWGSASSSAGSSSPNTAFAIEYDSTANKTIAFWNEGTTVKYAVGTVTGDSTNSISWGTAANAIGTTDAHRTVLARHHVASGKTLLAASDGTNLKMYVTTTSGTSVSVSDTSYTISTDEFFNYASMTPELSTNNESIVIAGSSADGADTGKSYVFNAGQTTSTNLTNSNYLGVAAETISDTNTGKITVNGGVNENQTGLTIGDDYFSDTSGNIRQFMTSSTTTDTEPTANTQSSAGDAGGYSVATAYDTVNDKICIYYRDDSSGYPTACVGDNSDGVATSWGTPVVITSNTYVNAQHPYNTVAYGNGAFVFICKNTSSDDGYAIAGTYTATNSLTLGSLSSAEFSSIYNNCWSIHYNDVASTFVVCHSTAGNQYSTLTPITNSGTTLTFGTGVNCENVNYNSYNYPRSMNGLYDPDSEKSIIGLLSTDDYDNMLAYVVTVTSGTISSVGSGNVIDCGEWDNTKWWGYDTTNDKILFLDSCYGNSNTKMWGSVLTVSGTTISQGTVTELKTEPIRYIGGYYDTGKSKFIIGYMVYSGSYLSTTAVVSISGTTPSWTDGNSLFDQTQRSFVTNGFYDPDIEKGLFSGQSWLSNSAVTAIMKYNTNTTYTQTDSQFIGKAIAADKLLLEEQDRNLIYGKASGSITKGKPVIVEADGDFTQDFSVDVPVSYSAGSQQTIKDSDTVGTSSITYDDALGYFVVFYEQISSSNNGYGRTYTESDKTLTLSQSLGSFYTNYTKILDSVYIGNSVHIVFYENLNSYLASRTVTISSDGTGTYGTENILVSSAIYSKGSCYYDSSKDVAVITYSTGSPSYTATAMAVTVSGGTITAGTAVSTGINDSYQSATTYDENSNIGVYAYRDDTNSKGKVRTITLSGTGNRTITLNTEVEFNATSARVQKDSLTYDPVSKKCFVAFISHSDWKTYGVVLTVSGTSVSAGTGVLIDNSLPSNSLACQGTSQGGITVAFRDSSSPSYFKGVVATISGTSFSLSNANTLNSEAVDSEWVSIAYKSTTNSNTIIYVTSSSEELEQITTIPNGTDEGSNLTTENFIGLADITSSASATSKVRIGGVDANQSGLTAGQLYYVKNDGTLSTTAETDKTVEAGKALSATKLLVNTS